MEIDHYYTQRDFVASPQNSLSAPCAPRNVGKIRIPPLDGIRKPTSLHLEIFGSDDETEDVLKQDNDAQRFLDSLDPDPNDMTIPFPKPRRIAGTRRVISAQNGKKMGEQYVWETGELNPDMPEIFQSITATPNLSGGSFEELRAECYAQCCIASGAPPPPSIPMSINALGAFQPAQAIPPTFRPRLVADQPDAATHYNDVAMADV